MPRSVALGLTAAICVLQGVLAYGWTDRNGFLERPFSGEAAWHRIDALRMKRGFDADGIGGFVGAGLKHDRPQPPLVPLTVGLAAALRGEPGVSHEAALLALQAFGALFVFGAYRLARRFVGRLASVGVAGLAASCPVLLPNLRVLSTSFPSAAVLVGSFGALLAAEGFSRRGRTIAFGAFAGVASLAQTTAPLFLVGSAAAALIVGLRRPGAKRATLVNAGLGLAASAAVATPWYAAHWESVTANFTRITGVEGRPIASNLLPKDALERWLYYPFHFLNDGLGWLLAAPFLAAAAWGLAAVVRGARRGRGPTSESSTASTQASTTRFRDGLILAAGPLAAFVPLTLLRTAGDSVDLLCFVPASAALIVRFGVTRGARPARAAVVCGLVAAASLHQTLGQLPPAAPTAEAPTAASRTTHGLAVPDGASGIPPTQAHVAGRTGTVGDQEMPFSILPDVNRRFAADLASVGAHAGSPAESWPLAAFVAEIFRDPYLVRPHLAQSTPNVRTHPYFGQSQLAYEAELHGKSFGFMNYEDVFVGDRDGFVQLGSMDYVVVDERPTADLLSVEHVMDGLARTDTEREVVLRSRPTDASRLSLIAIRRKGTLNGPRPASDLTAPDVRRVSVALSNGWRLVAARILVGADDLPLVVYWFDGLAPGEERARVWTHLLIDGETDSAAIPEVMPPCDCDADRPLLAITMHGFRAAPPPGGRAFRLRMSSARGDAFRGLATVGAATPGAPGNVNVLVPWDERPAPSRPPSGPGSRPDDAATLNVLGYADAAPRRATAPTSWIFRSSFRSTTARPSSASASGCSPTRWSAPASITS